MGSHVVCRRKGQIGENGENDQLVRADAITTHLINCIDSKVYIIQFHLIIAQGSESPGSGRFRDNVCHFVYGLCI
jgi:hypothetical protein